MGETSQSARQQKVGLKVQIASDLHLELLQRLYPGERLISSAIDADILLPSDNIANGKQAIELFKDWPVPVFWALFWWWCSCWQIYMH